MGILRAVVALAVVSATLAAGVAILSGEYRSTVRDTQSATTVTNETITANTNATNLVAESNRDVVYNDTITVRDNSTGAVIDPAGDYRWRGGLGNGTIFIVENPDEFSNGDKLDVTYSYTEPSDEQRAAKELSFIGLSLSEAIPLALGLAIVLGGLALVGGRR